MPLEISAINIPKIDPTDPSRQIKLKKFEDDIKAGVFEKIVNDIRKIVDNGLGKEAFSNLQMDLIDPVINFAQGAKDLPESSVKDLLTQHVRIFILVLESRLEPLSRQQQQKLQKLLLQLKKDFGSVPVLNKEVPLPRDEFLPVGMLKDGASNTLRQWQKIKWAKPGRNEKERLEFFSKRELGDDGKEHDIASVRRHLIALDGHTTEKGYALCYASCAFEETGNLHADHLQSSEDILARQLELMLAMNYDRIFAAKILTLPEAEGCFIEENGVIYGTKYFFMRYHNCVGIIWFISAAFNAGLGKGSQDVVEWFGRHEKFRHYLSDLKVKGKALDRSKILDSVDGKLLGDSVREWFLQTYKHHVAGAVMINRFERKLVADAPRNESRRARIDTVIMFALFDVVLESLKKRAEDRSQRKRRAIDVEVQPEKKQRIEGDGSSDEKGSSSLGSSDLLSLDLNNPEQREAAIDFGKKSLSASKNGNDLEAILRQSRLSFKKQSKLSLGFK